MTSSCCQARDRNLNKVQYGGGGMALRVGLFELHRVEREQSALEMGGTNWTKSHVNDSSQVVST